MKGKFYLLSSCMVDCIFCYKMTDTQSIKSMRVHATVMHDCIQLKVEIIVFHAHSIGGYYRNKLNF